MTERIAQAIAYVLARIAFVFVRIRMIYLDRLYEKQVDHLLASTEVEKTPELPPPPVPEPVGKTVLKKADPNQRYRTGCDCECVFEYGRGDVLKNKWDQEMVACPECGALRYHFSDINKVSKR